MAGSNERELKLKLTVEAPDPSKPAKAFQDIATQAQKASLAVQDAQKHMQRMGWPGGTPGSVGNGIAASAIMSPGGAGGYRQGAGPGWSPPQAGQSMAMNHFNQLNQRQLFAEFERKMHADRAALMQANAAAPLISPGGRGVGTGGVAGGAPSTGGIGVLGGAAASVAVIATAAAAFGNITEAAARMSSPLSTASDRFTDMATAVARAVPIVGDSLASIIGSVTSAAGRLHDWAGSQARDRYRENFPVLMQQDANNARGRDQFDALRRSGRDAGTNLAAVQAFPRIGLAAFNSDPIAFAAAERMNAAQEDVQTAKRASLAADQTAGGARLDLIRQRAAASRAVDAGEEARRAREDAARAAGVSGMAGAATAKSESWWTRNRSFILGGAVSSYTAGAGPLAEVGRDAAAKDRYADAVLKEQRAITQQITEQNKLLAEQERYGKASADALTKRHELSKAETALMRTRVDLLQDEYGRSQSAARSFGAMDSIGQRGALDALERFKRGGRDYVSGSELSVLQQLVPDLVNKDLDKANKENPLVKEFLKATGMRDEETINKEIKGARAELNLKVQVDEEQFAKLYKEQVEKLNGDLTGIIKKIILTENEKARIQGLAGRQ